MLGNVEEVAATTRGKPSCPTAWAWPTGRRTNHSGAATGQAPLLRGTISQKVEKKNIPLNDHVTVLLPHLEFHLPWWSTRHECAAAVLGAQRYSRYGSPAMVVTTGRAGLHTPPWATKDHPHGCGAIALTERPPLCHTVHSHR